MTWEEWINSDYYDSKSNITFAKGEIVVFITTTDTEVCTNFIEINHSQIQKYNDVIINKMEYNISYYGACVD